MIAGRRARASGQRAGRGRGAGDGPGGGARPAPPPRPGGAGPGRGWDRDRERDQCPVLDARGRGRGRSAVGGRYGQSRDCCGGPAQPRLARWNCGAGAAGPSPRPARTARGRGAAGPDIRAAAPMSPPEAGSGRDRCSERGSWTEIHLGESETLGSLLLSKREDSLINHAVVVANTNASCK
ncbi:translation initiation factor IF-2 [Aphelocoma coerulescens]|uniref:translation initiation factor IF-2 n=1 Tax=Aphelocoma coerulescens TaxID=39617 RepID=UPI00360463FB